MKGFKIRLTMLLIFFTATSAQAAQLTQVLRPGWLRYEVETVWDSLNLESNVGGLKFGVQQDRFLIPVRLAFGVSDGVEALAELPFVWYKEAGLSVDNGLVSGVTSGFKGRGVGDLSLGVKVKLLEDTGKTPAFLLESTLKFPTGSSSLDRYARGLAGEKVERGTGTSTFDLSVATTVSAYMHPFEGFLKLEIMSRGSDDQWAAGANQHVDYGTRTRAVGGLEMDVGKKVVLALDTSATIYAVDTWTVNGDNVLTGQGNAVSAFRDSALAQASLHLSGTTEWYLGPRIQIELARAFSITLRGDAGLTPDSSSWRMGAAVSGYFHPGIKLGGFFARAKESAPSKVSPSVKVSGPIATGTMDHQRDMVMGNLQRYIYMRYEAAAKAKAAGDWKTLAYEIKVLEDLDPTPRELKSDIEVMREKLYLMAAASRKKGDKAAAARDWLAAVRGWRKALQYRSDFEPARSALKKNKAKIYAAARKIYLSGIDAYVNKENPAAALKLWAKALELTPGDEKIKASIHKAKTRIQAIKKLK